MLSRQQVASKLNISVRTVDRYIKNGMLPRREIGGRIFIADDDIATFLEATPPIFYPKNSKATFTKKDTDFDLNSVKKKATDQTVRAHQSINQNTTKKNSEIDRQDELGQAEERNQATERDQSAERAQSEHRAQNEARGEASKAFAEKQFSEKQFAEKNFAEKAFSQKEEEFKKLYLQLNEELKKKQERLEGANYRVGQLEGMIKESVPMLEYKKAIQLEQTKRNELEQILTQIQSKNETLNFELTEKKQKLELATQKLNEEKLNKMVFLAILIVLFLLQPLWLIMQ